MGDWVQRRGVLLFGHTTDCAFRWFTGRAQEEHDCLGGQSDGEKWVTGCSEEVCCCLDIQLIVHLGGLLGAPKRSTIVWEAKVTVKEERICLGGKSERGIAGLTGTAERCAIVLGQRGVRMCWGRGVIAKELGDWARRGGVRLFGRQERA